MTVVSDQVEKVRFESLALVVGNPAIRDSTRRNMVKIDHACRRIAEQKDDLIPELDGRDSSAVGDFWYARGLAGGARET